jgi:hypothetical protein
MVTRMHCREEMERGSDSAVEQRRNRDENELQSREVIGMVIMSSEKKRNTGRDELSCIDEKE